MVEAFRTPCVFMLVILIKIVIHVLSVSYISDTSTGTKPSFYTALWTRTKIYPKRPLKLCEYTSNGWSQSVSDHFPVTKRALSVKFFSFSQSKKNVHDENMNSLTLAGETSPPKSNDKRLVHTYLLMSVLLLIKLDPVSRVTGIPRWYWILGIKCSDTTGVGLVYWNSALKSGQGHTPISKHRHAMRARVPFL